MNENEKRIKAIELILWCIEQQDIYSVLKTQGLSAEDIESVQGAICEVYDDLQATKKLWGCVNAS